jgi:hypothetical protein
VAGVGDERAFAVAGALEPGEQVVEGYPEAVDLVLGGGEWEPGVGVDVGELGGRLAHRVHRSHDGAREAVPGERGDEQRQAAADQQRAAEQLEGAFALLEGGRDDERRTGGTPGASDEQALALAAVDEPRHDRGGLGLRGCEERRLACSRGREQDAVFAREDLGGDVAAADDVGAGAESAYALLLEECGGVVGAGA